MTLRPTGSALGSLRLIVAVALILAAPARGQEGVSGMRVAVRPGAGLDVTRDGRDLLSYVSGMLLREGLPENRRRSTYVYPVRDLRGVNVLDDFPGDHVHHRGISWMWPSVTVDGKSHDLWHIRGIRQRFEKILEQAGGQAVAGFAVRNGWYVAEKRVVAEIVRLSVHPARMSAAVCGYMMDFDFVWEAVSQPVRLGGQKNEGKGYGGFGIRLAPRQDACITTPKGEIPKDSLHHRFKWVDYSGRFRGAEHRSGIAIFPHPDNDGFPNEWLLRRYGYIGECWPGLTGTTLEPGKPRRARYRVYVHDGDAKQAQVARFHKAWMNRSRIQPLYRDISPDGVAISNMGDRLRVTIDSELFTEYHVRGFPVPILHPVMAEGKVRVTRGFPMMEAPGEARDHAHHRGLWFTHGDVNGIDFWHDKSPRAGRIETTSLPRSGESNVIVSTHRWIDGKGSPVLEGRRSMRFGRIGRNRAIDFVITLTAAHGPVTFGDTKEGSMAIRLAPELRLKGPVATGSILNSSGHRDGRVWGKRAAWVDYSGVVGGKKLGVAILDHPENPSHPTWWHARDYGLFAANPFGVHDFEGKPKGTGDLKLPRGGKVTFRYRVIIHPGDAASADLPGLWRIFAVPAGR